VTVAIVGLALIDILAALERVATIASRTGATREATIKVLAFGQLITASIGVGTFVDILTTVLICPVACVSITTVRARARSWCIRAGSLQIAPTVIHLTFIDIDTRLNS
jgi:hypothetical protein